MEESTNPSESNPSSSSFSTTSYTNSRVGKGGSEFLSNLPSRGLFSSSTVLSTNPGGIRVYVCDHDTSPPVDQVISTNQTNILIRSLMLKKQRNDAVLKDVKGKSTTEITKGKRAAERTADGRASAKRASLSLNPRSSQQEKSSGCAFDKEIQSLTVDKLRILLRGRGLSVKGKKEELIARLRNDNVDGKHI
ncbi:hypothetical protein C5167_006620 [Papaver somniferum]|uniref:SAP domain-containing protein n=1 Tax=Papaver somniferum TaxID=3469 RepID=A0A4Y7JES3_PAPSO|nr:uncharacterized protein LOC113276606 [Papaver somniferum]RZC59317.1 hypothetical protein C5167_006620 [Papaver somniferum]